MKPTEDAKMGNDETERLARDCETAAWCLKGAGEFETGQAILTEAAALLRAQAARIAELEATNRGLVRLNEATQARAEKAEAERGAIAAAAYASGVAHARLTVSGHTDWNPSTVRDDLLLNIDHSCTGVDARAALDRLIAIAPTLAAENIAMRAEIARLTAALAETEARSAALVAGAYEAAAEVAAYEADFVPVKPNDFRKAIRALIPEIATAALDQIKAEAEARGYARGLEDANRSHLKTGGECECGLSGPCMQENCRSPILRALAKKEAGE